MTRTTSQHNYPAAFAKFMGRNQGDIFEDPLTRRGCKFRDCVFNPREATSLGNYFVWEHAHYTYPWSIDSAQPVRQKRTVHREYLNRKAMGWPDYYFNPLLFNEALKARR